MEKENTYGIRTEVTKETGNITVCMEKVNWCGLMEEVMTVNMNMIRNTDTVHSHGQMGENTVDIGKMENNMAEENIIWHQDRRKLDNGFKVKR